jgi:hypothetical protein
MNARLIVSSVLSSITTLFLLACAGGGKETQVEKYVQAPIAVISFMDQTSSNIVEMGGEIKLFTFSPDIKPVLPLSPKELVFSRRSTKLDGNMGIGISGDDSFDERNYRIVKLNVNGTEEELKTSCSVHSEKDLVSFSFSSGEMKDGEAFACYGKAKKFPYASSISTSFVLTSFTYEWEHGEVTIDNVHPQSRETYIVRSLLNAQYGAFTPPSSISNFCMGTVGKVMISTKGEPVNNLSFGLFQEGTSIGGNTIVNIGCFVNNVCVGVVNITGQGYSSINLSYTLLPESSTTFEFKVLGYAAFNPNFNSSWTYRLQSSVGWNTGNSWWSIAPIGDPTWIVGSQQ